MKPSEIQLRADCPLTATLGRAELEHAALLLVRVCQVHGDEWQPVSLAQVREVVAADVAAKTEPIASLVRNPFFRPDIAGLVEQKFVTTFCDADAPEAERKIEAVRLTDAAIARFARWHRAPTGVRHG